MLDASSNVFAHLNVCARARLSVMCPSFTPPVPLQDLDAVALDGTLPDLTPCFLTAAGLALLASAHFALVRYQDYASAKVVGSRVCVLCGFRSSILHSILISFILSLCIL